MDDSENFRSLKNLVIVIYPTDSTESDQIQTLLHSSISNSNSKNSDNGNRKDKNENDDGSDYDKTFWNLTLIGPNNNYQEEEEEDDDDDDDKKKISSKEDLKLYYPHEIWWFGQWTLNDLIKFVPNKKKNEDDGFGKEFVIRIIVEAFKNDDVTIIGYKDGNQPSIRVTIGYNQKENLLTLQLNKVQNSNRIEKLLIIPKLLELTCKAYSELNKLLKQKSQSNHNSNNNNSTQKQKSSSSNLSRVDKIRNSNNNDDDDLNIGEDLKKFEGDYDQLRKVVSKSSNLPPQPILNLSNPSKKPRVVVSNGFLNSDESD